MKHKHPWYITLLALFTACGNGTDFSYRIDISNPTTQFRPNEAVVIPLDEFSLPICKKGFLRVTNGDEMIPHQLDDLDGDNRADELVFLCDLKPQETKEFILTYDKNDYNESIDFEDHTWAQLMLKKDMKLVDSLFAKGGNLYQDCFHHGPAFENKQVAYRVYFDQRMSIDLYGKKEKRLELIQTNWYSDSIQRKCNYGKDILWVGKTASIGALRGWNGAKATFLNNVDSRTARIISYGPVRTVIEIKTNGWRLDDASYDLASRFILYDGHPEFQHDLMIPENAPPLCTGLMKKDDANYFHEDGIEGIWAHNIAEKSETVADTFGLAVLVKEDFIINRASDDLNHLFLLNTKDHTKLSWHGLGIWNENSDGFTNKEEFFSFLLELKNRIDNPVNITIQEHKKQ